jgi:hypothetical protein
VGRAGSGKTREVDHHREEPSEGLAEPLAAHTRWLLRRAVHELAATRPGRRGFAPALHIGVPGGPRASLDLSTAEPTDPGLRTDIVAALRVRAGTGAELVWLTRDGGLERQDLDAAWLAAARGAHEEAGSPLTFVVVTRRGWCDPRSGLACSWARVRPPASAAAAPPSS